jgi:hypothetical protein
LSNCRAREHSIANAWGPLEYFNSVKSARIPRNFAFKFGHRNFAGASAMNSADIAGARLRNYVAAKSSDFRRLCEWLEINQRDRRSYTAMDPKPTRK